MTDTQKLHIANGILRIRKAIKNCDLPVTEVGTIFPKQYTHLDLLEFELVVYKKIYNKLFEEIIIKGEDLDRDGIASLPIRY